MTANLSRLEISEPAREKRSLGFNAWDSCFFDREFAKLYELGDSVGW
jgi:hypothetical protein